MSKYTRSYSNHCVFFKKLKDEFCVYLLLYADNILRASKSKVEIAELMAQLRSKFEMKDFKEAWKILDMEIERDRVKGIVSCLRKSICRRY